VDSTPLSAPSVTIERSFFHVVACNSLTAHIAGYALPEIGPRLVLGETDCRWSCYFSVGSNWGRLSLFRQNR
jgi:hypothetical protein